MVDTLSRHWWTLVLRGVFAIIFGILAFVWPGITIVTLVLLFGAYAIVDGIFALIAAFRGGTTHRWLLALEGAVSIIAGIIAFAMPDLAALSLVLIIGFWAVVTGVMEVIAAIRLRKEIEGEWMLAALGFLSILFGVLLIVYPASGAIALVWMIGGFSVVFGGLLIGLGLRLRSRGQQVPMAAGGQPA